MQPIDRINAIEERARGVNLHLKRVCVMAGVDYSRVWRWQAGKSRPMVHTFERATSRLEAKLDEIEDEIRKRLSISAA